jgi:hypothetical protein
MKLHAGMMLKNLADHHGGYANYGQPERPAKFLPGTNAIL